MDDRKQKKLRRTKVAKKTTKRKYIKTEREEFIAYQIELFEERAERVAKNWKIVLSYIEKTSFCVDDISLMNALASLSFAESKLKDSNALLERIKHGCDQSISNMNYAFKKNDNDLA